MNNFLWPSKIGEEWWPPSRRLPSAYYYAAVTHPRPSSTAQARLTRTYHCLWAWPLYIGGWSLLCLKIYVCIFEKPGGLTSWTSFRTFLMRVWLLVGGCWLYLYAWLKPRQAELIKKKSSEEFEKGHLNIKSGLGLLYIALYTLCILKPQTNIFRLVSLI